LVHQFSLGECPLPSAKKTKNKTNRHKYTFSVYAIPAWQVTQTSSNQYTGFALITIIGSEMGSDPLRAKETK